MIGGEEGLLRNRWVSGYRRDYLGCTVLVTKRVEEEKLRVVGDMRGDTFRVTDAESGVANLGHWN